METLVQRVNRGRFRFELGGPSDGPSLLSNQTEEAQPLADESWLVKHQNKIVDTLNLSPTNMQP